MAKTFPDPRTDDAALLIHAQALADLSDAERAAYLDDFCGRQDPPPADDYKAAGRGRSLREILGEKRTASLLAKADKAKAAKAAAKT